MTGMGNVVSSTSCTSDHCIVSFTVSFDPTAFNTRIARSAHLSTRTAGPRIRLLVRASGVDVDAAVTAGAVVANVTKKYTNNTVKIMRTAWVRHRATCGMTT